MALDNEIKKELAEVIGSAIAAGRRSRDERFVTGKRLCEMYQMFIPSWVKTYGHLLPRIKAAVLDETTGERFHTGWAYNVAAIQKMIDGNRLEFILKPKEVYKSCGKTATYGEG